MGIDTQNFLFLTIIKVTWLEKYNALPSKVLNKYFSTEGEDYTLRLEDWHLIATDGQVIDCPPEHIDIYLMMLYIDVCRKTWYFTS